MRASEHFMAVVLVRVPLDLAADAPTEEAVVLVAQLLRRGLDAAGDIDWSWVIEVDVEHGVITLKR